MELRAVGFKIAGLHCEETEHEGIVSPSESVEQKVPGKLGLDD